MFCTLKSDIKNVFSSNTQNGNNLPYTPATPAIDIKAVINSDLVESFVQHRPSVYDLLQCAVSMVSFRNKGAGIYTLHWQFILVQCRCLDTFVLVTVVLIYLLTSCCVRLLSCTCHGFCLELNIAQIAQRRQRFSFSQTCPN